MLRLHPQKKEDLTSTPPAKGKAHQIIRDYFLKGKGVQTFKSLYFREPGGILFELATDGPGFASDEPVESLGERLALPPFLEARREEIEAGLQPLE